jgi:tryptophan-rich sensory protein
VKEVDDEREDVFEDEIKPEDGLLRYWMFINGEQFRLFAALAAALFGVFWCFLYILGGGKTVFGIVLLVLAVTSFGAWRLLDRQVREYERGGWKKGKKSPEREKIEIRVAIGLWLFIFVSIGLILLRQWQHGH